MSHTKKSHTKKFVAPEPKPAPPIVPLTHVPPDHPGILALRRILARMRWDNQGGYSSRVNGRWAFSSTGLAQTTPAELDALFALAGMTADEIETVGDCADCGNAIDGQERGYSPPCGSCLRPRHDLWVPKGQGEPIPAHLLPRKR